MMMSQVAQALGASLHGDDVLMTGVSKDTRDIHAGDLYVALKGERFDGHQFRTSVAIYRGEWMFGVNKTMRAAGLLPEGTYGVELTADLEPKRAVPAADVVAALAKSPQAQAAWDALSTSRKRQHLSHIEAA